MYTQIRLSFVLRSNENQPLPSWKSCQLDQKFQNLMSSVLLLRYTLWLKIIYANPNSQSRWNGRLSLTISDFNGTYIGTKVNCFCTSLEPLMKKRFLTSWWVCVCNEVCVRLSSDTQNANIVQDHSFGAVAGKVLWKLPLKSIHRELSFECLFTPVEIQNDFALC